jgi:hypothetical protein
VVAGRAHDVAARQLDRSVALAFAVLDLTGKASDVGIVFAPRSITNVLLLLFGGVLADRLPRQLVLTDSSFAAAGTQGLVATLGRPDRRRPAAR